MKSFNLYGTDFFGNPISPPSKGLISNRFVIPPFSVLNAREGVWQSRKKRWLGIGIESEVGRNSDVYTLNNKQKKYDYLPNIKTGISVFDPVLCELMYSWFCPPLGQILDPFAGGSVRGIIAHLLGYKYWGCDLRKEQINANYEQAKKITPDNKPTWITGDALDEVKKSPKADFIFSCPPYGDLEKYSDDKRDLSNMEYQTFIAAMKRIVSRSYKQLKDNCFTCFVVGDFRDEKGFYRNFVSDTIDCFLDNRFMLYNEIILMTSPGSLPVRITKYFNASRKIGKTHQNVLIFVKGDPKIATKKITGE